MRNILWFCAALAVTNSPAIARPWNPTPQQLAADYSSISHNKGSNGGLVSVRWIAAPSFTGGFSQVLDRYVVITVMHTTSGPSGMVYEDVAGVQVADLSGSALTEIAKDDIIPQIVSYLAGLEATMRQSTGGKAKLKALVFDAGPVRACGKGGLSVTYAGEKYTYDTPMPGCLPAR